MYWYINSLPKEVYSSITSQWMYMYGMYNCSMCLHLYHDIIRNTCTQGSVRGILDVYIVVLRCRTWVNIQINSWLLCVFQCAVSFISEELLLLHLCNLRILQPVANCFYHCLMFLSPAHVLWDWGSSTTPGTEDLPTKQQLVWAWPTSARSQLGSVHGGGGQTQHR